MSDGDGDKLHSSPIFLEGREEGRVFLGLLRELAAATEVSAESDLHEIEGAYFLVDVGPVRVGSGWHAPCVDEVRRIAVASLEERLGLFRRDYPRGYPVGGLRAFLVSLGEGAARNGVSRVLGDISVPYVTGVHRRRW